MLAMTDRRRLLPALALIAAPACVLAMATPAAVAWTAGPAATATPAGKATPAASAAATTRAQLLYVSAAPRTDVAFAVGRAIGTTTSSFYALRRVGSHWAKLPGSLGNEDDSVYGLAAGSATSAWALVTDYNPKTGASTRVVLHSTGRGFHKSALPKLPADADLQSVAATSSKNAYLAGDYGLDSDSVHPLLLKWNGHHWSRESVHGPFNDLVDVTASSASNVWLIAGLTAGGSTVGRLSGHTIKTTGFPVNTSSANEIATGGAKATFVLGSRTSGGQLDGVVWNGRH